MQAPPRAVFLALLLALGSCATPAPPAPANVVNDITQLNPITVERVVAPQSVEVLAALVRDHDGPISIGGGRFSQGGQTACTGCLFIDMRRLNRILAIDEAHRTITVQAGATWRQIQEAIDPKDLSPAIMQSYFNFTVGGSLSVNCHGDYVGHGPIIESVRSIRIVLADGSIVTASRSENRDIFDATIGGYGGVGIIVEATLDLAQNERLARQTYRMHVGEYVAWHQAHVLNSANVVLESAVIYPHGYHDVAATVATLTDAPPTITDRLGPVGKPDALHRALLSTVTHTPFGPFIHQRIYDPMTMRPAVASRNYLASHDAYGLEPA
ncbi:MAG: FAD-dependent oxidoreductase [Pseudomonadota bacterium]